MPTVQLVQIEANVGEEEEEGEDDELEDIPIIPVAQPCTSKRRTTKPDRKGKDVVVSP